MGRPVFPHELSDPDFCWLISNFQEHHPDHICVETGALPIVFVKTDSVGAPLLALPPAVDATMSPEDFEEDKF